MPRRSDEDDGATDARWTALGDDLAARAAAQEVSARADDAAEIARAELARVTLVDRLRAHVGAPLVVDVVGAGAVRGRLVSAGPDAVVLAADPPAYEVLVPLGAVHGVGGAGSRARAPRAISQLDRALGLTHALRRYARDRSRVRVTLVDGSVRTGTVDAVAADHLELAEHPLDVARRRDAVLGHRLVPLTALATVTAHAP